MENDRKRVEANMGWKADTHHPVWQNSYQDLGQAWLIQTAPQNKALRLLAIGWLSCEPKPERKVYQLRDHNKAWS